MPFTFHRGSAGLWQWAGGFGVCQGLFLVGSMIFCKVERTFADTISRVRASATVL